VPNGTHGVRYRPSPERESADQLGGRIEKSARRVVAGCLDAAESLDMQVELSQPTKAWPRQIRSYAELQEQLHHDLRAQHPEWIDANGYRIVGPYREIYIKHDNASTSDSTTEIQFPVEKA